MRNKKSRNINLKKEIPLVKRAFSLIELGIVVLVIGLALVVVTKGTKRMIAGAKCSGQIENGGNIDYEQSASSAYTAIKAIDNDKAFKDCINAQMGLATNFGSCKTILDTQPDSTSGVYTLGAGHKVYCDMVTDGGGWTLVVAQYELNAVLWNEGIQGDYMIEDLSFTPSLLDTYGGIAAGFSLNTAELPTHTQTAFGKGSDPTFIGYSNYVYETGDLTKALMVNIKDGLNYHVSRLSNTYYSAHDPDLGFNGSSSQNFNTLTYDLSPGINYTYAFAPLHSNPVLRGYHMEGDGPALDGLVHSTAQTYAWTIWVR